MANPIISRTTLMTSSVAMRTQGVVAKSAFLLSLAAVSGFGVFFYGLATAPDLFSRIHLNRTIVKYTKIIHYSRYRHQMLGFHVDVDCTYCCR